MEPFVSSRLLCLAVGLTESYAYQAIFLNSSMISFQYIGSDKVILPNLHIRLFFVVNRT